MLALATAAAGEKPFGELASLDSQRDCTPTWLGCHVRAMLVQDWYMVETTGSAGIPVQQLALLGQDLKNNWYGTPI